jgi:hypothetical protein
MAPCECEYCTKCFYDTYAYICEGCYSRLVYLLDIKVIDDKLEPVICSRHRGEWWLKANEGYLSTDRDTDSDIERSLGEVSIESDSEGL